MDAPGECGSLVARIIHHNPASRRKNNLVPDSGFQRRLELKCTAFDID
jgi:hypothetical protein